MADDKPIIVIKKKGGHGGHHGGAWKVAYADFVTAMMAFFMVMWLLNSAQTPTKQAVASYFRKPGLFEHGSGTPLELGGAGIMDDSYSPPRPEKEDAPEKWELRKRLPTLEEELKKEVKSKRNKGLFKNKPDLETDPEGIHVSEVPKKLGTSKEKSKLQDDDPENGSVLTPHTLRADPTQEVTDEEFEELFKEVLAAKVRRKKEEGDHQTLEQIREVIEEQIASSPELQDLLGQVDVKVDADGLTLEIMDTEKTSMFALGSSKVLPQARAAFHKLTQLLAPLPNTIELIGHTDAKPFSKIPGGLTNWDLSAARANEARRILIESGFDETRITGVAGKAATQLKRSNDPFAAANRRITIKMKFDLTRTINLEKEPDGIEKAQRDKKELERVLEEKRRAMEEERELLKRQPSPPPAAVTPAVGTPPSTPLVPTSAKTTAGQEPVHEITPEEILKGIKQKKSDGAPPLEKDTASALGQETPSGQEKDKIFGDMPVFGPSDPFDEM